MAKIKAAYNNGTLTLDIPKAEVCTLALCSLSSAFSAGHSRLKLCSSEQVSAGSFECCKTVLQVTMAMPVLSTSSSGKAGAVLSWPACLPGLQLSACAHSGRELFATVRMRCCVCYCTRLTPSPGCQNKVSGPHHQLCVLMILFLACRRRPAPTRSMWSRAAARPVLAPSSLRRGSGGNSVCKRQPACTESFCLSVADRWRTCR